MTKTIGSGDARDLDETRRLLYMALLAPRTKKYELGGTIVNALVHHHAVAGLDAQEVMDRLVDVFEGDASARTSWLKTQIDRISGELDG